MPSFQSDGVRIAYWDEGEGEPILLIHGFASNVATNWTDPGWVRTLT
jgi:pimeloyl-ACP methyl ester carboxylesterase